MEHEKIKFFFLIPQVKNFAIGDGSVSSDFLRTAAVERVVDPAMTGERYRIDVSSGGVRFTAGNDVGFFRTAATFEQILQNLQRPDNPQDESKNHHQNNLRNCRQDDPRNHHINNSQDSRQNDPRNNHQQIPFFTIDDEPDFATRGFYHDVTRGRVPTVETLKQLVDNLAFYKINQFQLYVEHTFAFKSLPELWADKTPLTADDISELDKYCAERYIDLVPSLSTFGHLYELLRLPKYEHLNELNIRASETKRCLWDRMAHYTLDVGNTESFELVKTMIEEYAPLFRSRYFNICCDETFDLGTGKNAATAEERGVGRLYVDFVKKIIGVVRSMGKTPMLWGDIVLKHPELIAELSSIDTNVSSNIGANLSSNVDTNKLSDKNVNAKKLSGDNNEIIFLNWEYTPEVTYEPVKTFRDAGVTQYVCPGVNGWSRFAADVDRACANISKMARYGKDAGAVGLLNTDWGDCGHVNLLSNSYHGLAFGAEKSWRVGDRVNGNNIGNDNVSNNNVNDNNVGNNNANDCLDNFDARFAFLQWGVDDDGHLGKLLRELGAVCEYHFGNLYAWINDKKCLWHKEDDVKSMCAKTLADKYHRAQKISAELSSIHEKITDDQRKQDFQEYIFAADATAWLLSMLLIKKKYEYDQDISDNTITAKDVANAGRLLIDRFKKLWRTRNRESELRDVVETFEMVLEWVDNCC